MQTSNSKDEALKELWDLAIWSGRSLLGVQESYQFVDVMPDVACYLLSILEACEGVRIEQVLFPGAAAFDDFYRERGLMPEWPFSVNGSGEGVVIDLVVTEEGRRAIKNGIWMEQTSFNGY